MANDIIPFGKHKGKPIFALAEDKSYTDWLIAQPWFKEQHMTIYNVVINNYRTTDDTPEHNAIQIQFLDSDFSAKLAYLLHPDLFYWTSENINKELIKTLNDQNKYKDDLRSKFNELNNRTLLHVSDPSLENGYDVSFTVNYGLSFSLDKQVEPKKPESNYDYLFCISKPEFSNFLVRHRIDQPTLRKAF